MPRKRLYTEKDFSAILRRATELQRSAGVDNAPGLSLDELEQVAEDVGIGPDFVRRAALEMDEGQPDKGDRLLGGPIQVDREWMVEGEMSDTKWEDALGEIRRTFGAEGTTRLEGHTRDWVHRDQMGGRIHVSMSPAGPQTRVRISYGMKEWLWLHVVFLSVGIGGVAVQYSLLQLGALAETGIALLVMLAFYMVGWLVFRNFTRRQDRTVQRLLSRLDDLLSKAGAETRQRLDQPAAYRTDRVDETLVSDQMPLGEDAAIRSRGRERS